MPDFLEKKLKAEYPGNDRAVYGTLNALGMMHGNKITAKGKAAEAKHKADMGHGKKHPAKNLGAHLRPRRGR